jgi:FkbM family methyltransferase
MASLLRHRFRGCNVTVHECAVGAKSGSGTLRIPTFGEGIYTTRSTLLEDLGSIQVKGELLTKSREITVPIVALDDLDLGSVGFIKIDVEGFEIDVLQGAMRLIKRHKPAIYIEIEQRRHQGRSIEDIFEMIAGLGYTGWFIRSSQMTSIVEFNIETMQASHLEDTPDFVNNFLFVPIG